MGVKHLRQFTECILILRNLLLQSCTDNLLWMLWTLKGKLQDKITKIEKKILSFLKQIFLGTVCVKIYFYGFGI